MKLFSILISIICLAFSLQITGCNINPGKDNEKRLAEITDSNNKVEQTIITTDLPTLEREYKESAENFWKKYQHKRLRFTGKIKRVNIISVHSDNNIFLESIGYRDCYLCEFEAGEESCLQAKTGQAVEISGEPYANNRFPDFIRCKIERLISNESSSINNTVSDLPTPPTTNSSTSVESSSEEAEIFKGIQILRNTKKNIETESSKEISQSHTDCERYKGLLGMLNSEKALYQMDIDYFNKHHVLNKFLTNEKYQFENDLKYKIECLENSLVDARRLCNQ